MGIFSSKESNTNAESTENKAPAKIENENEPSIVKGEIKNDNGKELLIIPIDDVKQRESFKRSNAFEFYKNKYIKIYASSFNKADDLILYDSLHPIINGFYDAYGYHLPIAISPDLIWLIISQQFTHHILKNSEKLRHIFVNFEGKKELSVFNSTFKVEEISDELWNEHIEEFSNKISEFVGKDIEDLIVPNFSTSEKINKIVGKTTLMSAMQNYFKYQVFCPGCGFPFIQLEGTLSDWQNIKERILKLKNYDLNWWIERITKIIDKIIETKADPSKIDRIFWKNIIYNTKGSTLASGTKYPADAVGGWLFELYPFNKYGNIRTTHRFKDGMDEELYTKIDKNNFLDEFACDLLETPITVNEVPTNTIVEVKLFSGVIGLSQNSSSVVIPKIGWFIKEEKPRQKAEENLMDKAMGAMKSD